MKYKSSSSQLKTHNNLNKYAVDSTPADGHSSPPRPHPSTAGKAQGNSSHATRLCAILPTIFQADGTSEAELGFIVHNAWPQCPFPFPEEVTP